MSALRFIPNAWTRNSPLFKVPSTRSSTAKICRQLSLTTQLARSFRQHVEEALFQAASLVALPVLIVVVTEIDNVLAGM